LSHHEDKWAPSHYSRHKVEQWPGCPLILQVLLDQASPSVSEWGKTNHWDISSEAHRPCPRTKGLPQGPWCFRWATWEWSETRCVKLWRLCLKVTLRS
jgi:hypothetical protein